MNKKLPLILVLLVGAGVGAVALLQITKSDPNSPEGSAGKMGDGAADSASSFAGQNYGQEDDTGELPKALQRSMEGQLASSQYSDVNYGQSSLGLVGGELNLGEAMELQGNPLQGKSAEGEMGGGVSGEGFNNAMGGGGDAARPSLFGQGQVGGFDKQKSALDDTASFYGSQGNSGPGAGSAAGGKGAPGKGAPKVGEASGGSAAGTKSGGAQKGMARTGKMGMRRMGNEGPGDSQNATQQLAQGAGYAVGAIGQNNNFQVQAGALGQVLDGVQAASALDGITAAEGVSITDVPQVDNANAPVKQGGGNKLFEWYPERVYTKGSGSLVADWSSLGDYTATYGETAGLSAILATYFGFPGVVAAHSSSRNGLSGRLRCFLGHGRWRRPYRGTHSSFIVVKVTMPDGSIKEVTSKYNPFMTRCHGVGDGHCHRFHYPSVAKIDGLEQGIPFGESRYLLLYYYTNTHALPDTVITGFLVNLKHIKDGVEPMIVPLNVNEGYRPSSLGNYAATLRNQHAPMCLGELAKEYTSRCSVHYIEGVGLMSQFAEKAAADNVDGGVRGVCVQHFGLVEQFQECINTGRWSPYAPGGSTGT